MATPFWNRATSVLCLALAALLCHTQARAGELKLMPTPKSVKVTGGDIRVFQFFGSSLFAVGSS